MSFATFLSSQSQKDSVSVNTSGEFCRTSVFFNKMKVISVNYDNNEIIFRNFATAHYSKVHKNPSYGRSLCCRNPHLPI